MAEIRTLVNEDAWRFRNAHHRDPSEGDADSRFNPRRHVQRTSKTISPIVDFLLYLIFCVAVAGLEYSL
jgi:hypothetical protein